MNERQASLSREAQRGVGVRGPRVVEPEQEAMMPVTAGLPFLAGVPKIGCV